MHTLIQALALSDVTDADPAARYRWRSRDDRGAWCSPMREGSAQELVAEHGPHAVSLVLNGTEVVSSMLAVQAAERRHLVSLAPFELEDYLVVPPESVHVASGTWHDGQVVVAHTDQAALARHLAALEALGLDVRHCLPLPLLLPRSESGWSLALSEGLVHVHHGAGQGFSLELELAAVALTRLAAETTTENVPTALALYAATEDALDALEALVSRTLLAERNDAAKPALSRYRQPLWGVLLAPADCALDLRQGAFALRLPWRRWWHQARATTLLALAALLLHVGVQVTQVQVQNQRYRTLEADIAAVYRSAVPEGMLVDAEQQLRSQLARYEGGSGNNRLLPLLAAIAPLLSAQDGLAISRLQYQADRQELQLALSARRNGDILALAEALRAQGLQAQPQTISRQGTLQLANLLIREK